MEWISVKDRLPRLKLQRLADVREPSKVSTFYASDEVLVASTYDPLGYMLAHIECGDPETGETPKWYDDMGGREIYVTHWMPLPKLPSIYKWNEEEREVEIADD